MPALALCAWAGQAAAAGIVEVVGASGAPIARVEADEWCIAWNHSVAGFEVRDCYALRDGRMVLEHSHQPDFAAGLGHIPGRGTQRSDGAGGYRIEGIGEAVPGNCYRLRVGSASVDHRLVAGDTNISLTALAAGESVAIRAGSAQTGNRTC
ncbi:DUF1850 domain-containing protein [Aquamicrobium sp. LC103]|nr:DUF1850 domain-containing protein [Aquamicrobium sp. LC103]